VREAIGSRGLRVKPEEYWWFCEWIGVSLPDWTRRMCLTRSDGEDCGEKEAQPKGREV
jgi:hypothetical protein